GQPDLLQRPALGDLGQHLGRRYPGGVQDGADHRRVLEVLAPVVAGGEQPPVHRREPVGEPVPDHHPRLQRQQALHLGRVVLGLPDRWLPFGHVVLHQRERGERHLPGSPGVEAGQQVLVGVAGERAQVVPGDRERRQCHGCANRRFRRPIPRSAGIRLSTSRPTRPIVPPMAAPARTSLAWWCRRYTRLVATEPANARQAAVPAGVVGSMTAVENAARVCPLGKLLLFGVLTGTFPISRAAVGRSRFTTAFTALFTPYDSAPDRDSARAARRRAGPRRRPIPPASTTHTTP